MVASQYATAAFFVLLILSPPTPLFPALCTLPTHFGYNGDHERFCVSRIGEVVLRSLIYRFDFKSIVASPDRKNCHKDGVIFREVCILHPKAEFLSQGIGGILEPFLIPWNSLKILA